MTSSFLVGPAQFYISPDRPVTNNNCTLQFFSRRFNSIGFGSSKFTRNSSLKVAMADSDSNSSGADYAEIMVIRHGETAWNADGRIQGHLDVELNDAGRKQAAAVANRLSKDPKISLVYSSDLKRAYETAQIIAARCGGLNVVTDPNLRERHLGDLQGLVIREAAKLSPEAYRAFNSHRTCQDIPGGGESLDQLYDRCTAALERIGGMHKGERVVVVTHGGVIRSLYQRACPNGRSIGKVTNTSINTFHLYDEDKWTIKSWGDVSHMKETDYLESGFGGDGTSG
uniref:phosphoglycerate mutase-like protein 4 n=1 Tax=Fragaria vesca subsp. vesca TaxID=101020 RepID=UPI0005C8C243|nr:PREDICTED: phosphoglycerate mutase-like protein 4 [Fragaria vesca subsp. vesca]